MQCHTAQSLGRLQLDVSHEAMVNPSEEIMKHALLHDMAQQSGQHRMCKLFNMAHIATCRLKPGQGSCPLIMVL